MDAQLQSKPPINPITTNLWMVAGVLVALGLLAVPIGFKQIYFRDYAIIYDGAYRLLLGQHVYQDFGIPVGPVSFWGPWWAFTVWGPSWEALLGWQMIVNALSVVGFAWLLYLLRTEKVRFWLSLLSWVIFYCWPNTLPWYNTTALILVLWALIPLAILARGLTDKQSDTFVSVTLGAVSGFCLTAAILTKQDFGLMGLLLISVCALCWFRNRGMLFYLGGCIVIVIVCYISYWSLAPKQAYAYWFNHGQAPHEVRFGIGRFIQTWLALNIRLVVSLGIVAALIMRYGKGLFHQIRLTESKALVIMFGLVLISFVTSATSGIEATHHYYWAPLLLSASLVVSPIGKRLHPALIVLWLMMFANPLLDAYSSYRYPRLPISWASGWQMGNPLDGGNPRTYQLAKATNASPLYWPAEVDLTIEVIAAKVALLRAQRHHLSLNQSAGQDTIVSDRDLLLNLTELTFLYQALGLQPPVQLGGIPLWYDSHTSFFSDQQQALAANIKLHRYKLILTQPAHTDLGHIVQDALAKHYANCGSYPAPAEGKQVTVWMIKSCH